MPELVRSPVRLRPLAPREPKSITKVLPALFTKLLKSLMLLALSNVVDIDESATVEVAAGGVGLDGTLGGALPESSAKATGIFVVANTHRVLKKAKNLLRRLLF